jgi:N,N'-diacetyllegionaminate synthase
MKKFNISNRIIGSDEPCFVIAEMGLAHDGSLGAAYAFIDAAVKAGADCVKFQTHIAEAEGTSQEKFRVNTFPQDETRQDYWKRTAFSKSQWFDLKKYADSRKIEFMSSAFSIEAMNLLNDVGIPAWKVGSGEMTNLPLLEAMVKTKKPILLSTGMSSWSEIDKSVEYIQKHDTSVLVFQCVNRYPCPPEHIGLNVIEELQMRYDIPIGFSDHSGDPSVGFAAVVKGSCMLECHVTFNKQGFGPDNSSSLTFDEFRDMICSIRLFEKIKKNPMDKDKEAEELYETRKLFTKSVVLNKDLEAGCIITKEDLDYKKPGTGISVKEYEKVIGRTTRKKLYKDEIFSWSELVK